MTTTLPRRVTSLRSAILLMIIHRSLAWAPANHALPILTMQKHQRLRRHELYRRRGVPAAPAFSVEMKTSTRTTTAVKDGLYRCSGEQLSPILNSGTNAATATSCYSSQQRRALVALVAAAAPILSFSQPSYAIDVGVTLKNIGSSMGSAATAFFSSELFTYFLKTTIQVAVPGAVVLIVGLILFGGDKGEQPPAGFLSGLGGGRRKGGQRIMPKPKTESFNLQVVHLNKRYEAVQDLFTTAFDGERTAAAAAARRNLEKGLRAATEGLSSEDIVKVERAVGRFLRKDGILDGQMKRLSFEMRSSAVQQPAPSPSPSPSLFGKLFNSTSDVVTNSSNGSEDEASPGRTTKMMKKLFNKKASRYGELFEEKVEAEIELFGKLSSILNTEQRERLMDDVASFGNIGFYRDAPGNSLGLGESNDEDGIEEEGEGPSLQGSAMKGRVFNLVFKGDVQASQGKALRKEVSAVIANAKPGIDQVVLELDSGGGTVTGYGFAAAQLERLKSAGLHLTICVTEVAASGGYMMACTADKIVAGPLAILGSIGVITDIPNVYERLKKEGVVFNTVTAGKYKRQLTPTKPTTEKDLKKTQQDLEDILTLFKSFVKRNRPQLDIDSVATGEIWFGPDALEKNLCDELATVDEVLMGFVREGHDVYQVTTAAARPSFIEDLGLDLDDDAVAKRTIAALLGNSRSNSAAGAAAAVAAAAATGRSALRGLGSAPSNNGPYDYRIGGVGDTSFINRFGLDARSGSLPELNESLEGEGSSFLAADDSDWHY